VGKKRKKRRKKQNSSTYDIALSIFFWQYNELDTSGISGGKRSVMFYFLVGSLFTVMVSKKVWYKSQPRLQRRHLRGEKARLCSMRNVIKMLKMVMLQARLTRKLLRNTHVICTLAYIFLLTLINERDSIFTFPALTCIRFFRYVNKPKTFQGYIFK